eukprot:TRINITY_DN25801_c0_g1_i1.p2 TRINITY_DN25801_c0_g1~~TRINITY_DN25801_c0_g1_i1.p2  ORF type:complete len:153 (+),score=9.63 TRINITY_DN25801_c0_g1_i1:599-1057(+)
MAFTGQSNERTTKSPIKRRRVAEREVDHRSVANNTTARSSTGVQTHKNLLFVSLSCRSSTLSTKGRRKRARAVGRTESMRIKDEEEEADRVGRMALQRAVRTAELRPIQPLSIPITTPRFVGKLKTEVTIEAVEKYVWLLAAMQIEIKRCHG